MDRANTLKLIAFEKGEDYDDVSEPNPFTMRGKFRTLCQKGIKNSVVECTEEQKELILIGLTYGLSYKEISETENIPNLASIASMLIKDDQFRKKSLGAQLFAANEGIGALEELVPAILRGELGGSEAKAITNIRQMKSKMIIDQAKFELFALGVSDNKFENVEIERQREIILEAYNSVTN